RHDIAHALLRLTLPEPNALAVCIYALQPFSLARFPLRHGAGLTQMPDRASRVSEGDKVMAPSAACARSRPPSPPRAPSELHGWRRRTGRIADALPPDARIAERLPGRSPRCAA